MERQDNIFWTYGLPYRILCNILREAADFVLYYEGEIPGYSPRDCGNYLDNNLKLAQIYMDKFKREVLDNPTLDRLTYPE